MSTQQLTAPTKLQIVFAGEVFDGTDEQHPLPRDAAGNTLPPVRVRAMPTRHLGRVLRLADHEPELLDFVCSIFTKDEGEQAPSWKTVEEGWSDNLHDETHELLYKAAERQNFSRAAKWAERQIAAKKFVGEITLKGEEIMQPLLAPVFEQMQKLLRSLETPSASPATPSTKS
ncbi:MAG: hypothetical protein KF715_08660 [Candidatus Didemnitutus sp.]|nr:hypothetical protein [Candidatus Didemnitutus sp.]